MESRVRRSESSASLRGGEGRVREAPLTREDGMVTEREEGEREERRRWREREAREKGREVRQEGRERDRTEGREMTEERRYRYLPLVEL
jgi:hypothetical protein